ncbi:HalOD1 output domain-containing protein [Halomicroarcula sp. GCM10025709]|uniref:HalOD1 output domain-containing protein n=1 Tax=Haloarcula TaxID=2237 RepID=UPI0024C2E031|nr:HalOD1 output domain-containing protein [Halomicroarcula sp. YJ-61-S]
MSEAHRQTRSVTHTVISAVARYEGVDPASLTPPLFDVVDPDALDALFADRYVGTPGLRCAFTYRGHRVEVESSGSVTVRDYAAEPGAAGSADTVES